MAKIQFPQGPIVDDKGMLSLEGFMWLQNPQFLTITLGTVVGIASGGTGTANLTNHGVVVAGANALSTVAPGSSGNALISNGADWVSGKAGSVSSVSVINANGFSGSVATPTTTPAITIQDDGNLLATQIFGA